MEPYRLLIVSSSFRFSKKDPMPTVMKQKVSTFGFFTYNYVIITFQYQNRVVPYKSATFSLGDSSTPINPSFIL